MRRRTAAPARAGRRSRSAAAVLAGTLGAAGILLSACSNSGVALARQACTHVGRSITLYTRAEHAPDEAVAKRDATQATSQLEAALPLAAAANSADAAYNPLMTTLQESERISEAELIPALQAQCAAAAHPSTSQSPVTPAPGSGTPTRTVTRPG